MRGFHHYLIAGLLSLLSGCLAAPNASPLVVNAGVNIVAPTVLASEKLTPSSQPTAIYQIDLINIISQSDQSHKRLIEILRNSGFVRTLQQEGPYTIFAPTDEAFSKLPPGLLEKLMQPGHHAELVSFVKYHLLKGRIGLADLQQTNGQVYTLAKSPVIVKGIDGKVMVNDANIIRTDVTACNGNVQWVDGVLLPPG